MTTTTYKEKHRPQFHFTPEENWMNDPNGMVFYDDEYHLFYQYHPYGNTWGPMHWGHAVSKDLIEWENLPVALYPDEHGAIFSGSAVVDWNNTTGFFDDRPGLVAIYTNADEYPESGRPRQRQSLAYSKDNGRSWVKYDNNPVLSDETITDYRDPKVFWHAETDQWIMILATGQAVTLYTSSNLKEWEYASKFGTDAGSHEGVWECPDLFKLAVDGDENDQKWVMLVSIGDNPDLKEGSRTQYFIGEFDGKTFVNDNPADTVLWLDYGRDNYAGVSWSDVPYSDGRRIYIAWMSNWRYANQVPTEKWRSAMTFPRELTLRKKDNTVRLFQNPIEEIDNIRERTVSFDGLSVSEDKAVSYSVNQLSEVTAVFDNQSADSFSLVFGNSNEEKTVIRYDVEKERLYLDRTKAGNDRFSDSFAAVQQVPLKSKDGKIKIRALIDASSIEIFANNGEAAVTSLIFPHSPINQLSLLSSNGVVEVRELRITALNSIWGEEK